ncbi:MAG: hypothetical protein Q9185_002276 [Variospora sp. 1 TL-2023]
MVLQCQRGKPLSIKCTLFERENYLNERLRDWNFGVYHAKPQFDECLPDRISNKLTSALSDPFRGLSEHDVFPMFNAQTGELLMEMPTPNALRLNRSRFRALIAEGLDIQVFILVFLATCFQLICSCPKYSKRLSSIACPDDSSSVTARFEDGTAVTGNLLIGADGANSTVRESLLGPSKAGLKPLPVFGCGAVESLPAEISRKIRDINDLYFVAYHPEGPCAFMAIHDVPDASKPETWKWMYSLTWPDKDSPTPAGPEAIRQNWLSRAEKLAEPYRSAYLAIAPTAKIWCDRLAQWPTEHRGQGLNNGILDAAYICRALNTHCQDGKPITEALAVYEKEVQERGRAAVIESGRNSVMVHDWEQLKQSPVFSIGLEALQKAS